MNSPENGITHVRNSDIKCVNSCPRPRARSFTRLVKQPHLESFCGELMCEYRHIHTRPYIELRVESASACINKHLRVDRCVFGCFLVREIAHYTPPYLSTHVSNALKSHTTERSKRPLPDSLTCVYILAKIDQVVGQLGTILINHI